MAAQIDAGVDASVDLTEKLLMNAQASSAFSINFWSGNNVGLEECVPATFPKPSPAVLVTPILSLADPNIPDAFKDCDPANGDQPCFCRYTFKNPTHEFNVFLDKFVAANKCLGVNDGRSALIQLGPIFTFGRRVPPYLFNKSFASTEMIQSFAQLWDNMSAVLAQAKFTTNESPTRPEWIISIGNEVNIYLDNPSLIDPVDGTSPLDAWANYMTFYQKASDYVRGRLVDIDGGQLDRNNAVLAWATFSTTWSTDCSPGSMLVHPFEPEEKCKIFVTRLDPYVSMLTSSNFASYTYYPFPHCPPDAGGQDATWFHDRVKDDFDEMALAALTASTRVGRQLPIVLQEVGVQSSCGTAPDGGVPAYSNHVFEDEQAAFVQGALPAFKDYNESNWIPEFDWWAGFVDTDPSTPDPSQAPFVVPRIVSYNTFMLHDFSDFSDVPTSCPFANINDFDGGPGTTPTQLGTFLCSLGLRKRTGEPKLAWDKFVDASVAIDTNPLLDPDRTCP